MAQALYRRWRPQTWEAVVGQDHVVQTLRNAVRGERVAHAYLFAGPRGTGKTTTARLLAKAVNCLEEDPAGRPCNHCPHCLAVNEGSYIDLIEIDAASNTSVEDVRDLRDKINFSPNEGAYKVYIIDEVHMLSTAAFNALLKTLEEPPAHAIFVLATTEVHKIPATVLSRCQRHEFRRLPVTTILSYLEERVQEEQFEVDADALELIARQATGSLRDAISLLDQLTSTGQAVDLARAQSVIGTATEEAVMTVIDALVEGQAGQGLTILNRAIDSGADPRQLARQIVDYLRGLLLMRMGSADLVEAVESVAERMRAHSEGLSLRRLMSAIDAFSEAALERRATWQPKLPLELALVEAMGHAGGETSVERTVGEAGGEDPPANPKRLMESSGSSRETEETQPVNVAPPSGAGQALGKLDPESRLTFQAVLDRWGAILDAAYELEPRCQALLNSGRPLALQEDKLVVGFASDLLREKMEKSDNRTLILRAFEGALGRPLGLRCVLTSRWQADRDSERPPVEEGGMVATALRDLGAEVADVRAMEEEEDGGD